MKYREKSSFTKCDMFQIQDQCDDLSSIMIINKSMDNFEHAITGCKKKKSKNKRKLTSPQQSQPSIKSSKFDSVDSHPISLSISQKTV